MKKRIEKKTQEEQNEPVQHQQVKPGEPAIIPGSLQSSFRSKSQQEAEASQTRASTIQLNKAQLRWSSVRANCEARLEADSWVVRRMEWLPRNEKPSNRDGMVSRNPVGGLVFSVVTSDYNSEGHATPNQSLRPSLSLRVRPGSSIIKEKQLTTKLKFSSAKWKRRWSPCQLQLEAAIH